MQKAIEVSGLEKNYGTIHAAMVFLIISFVKSTNAFATVSTVIGTLVDFLTGSYIPIGILPPAMQTARLSCSRLPM